MDKEWCLNMAKKEGDAEIGAGQCLYCDDNTGWIEMDNNGPIVPCPMCNSDGSRPRT